MDALRRAVRIARGNGGPRRLVLPVVVIVVLGLVAAFCVWLLTPTAGSTTAADRGASGSGGAVAARPPSGTVVSLTFNFGLASQYRFARPLLRKYGLHGTFYVAPRRLDAGDSCCVTWKQAEQLYAEGDEIGGSSLDGLDLTVPFSRDPEQDYAAKKQQVCGAASRLAQLGLDPRSFAYPAGAHAYEFPTLHRSLADLVASCGFMSGRIIGGLSADGGPSAVAANKVPPSEPYVVRTPDETSTSPIALADLQRSVLAAPRGTGRSWVPVVFDEICHPGDRAYTTCMSTRRPVDDRVLAAFLGWLRNAGKPGGAPAGTVVQTVRTVMGARPQPPLPASERLALQATGTVVSLTFDDGDVTQAMAGDLLREHGMHGTFYINTGPIDARDPAHLTWEEVLRLHRDGNDIGGHTRSHVNLTDPAIPEATKRNEVCQDRTRLAQMGLDPQSFAYPYGALDKAAETLVESCGYRSGRSAGSVDPRGPVFAEKIPPPDPFATLALDGPTGPTVEGGPSDGSKPLTLDYLQHAVVSAADHGGGWVQVILHRICTRSDPRFTTCMSGESPIEDSTFNAFLNWLQHDAPRGTSVRTVRQVMSPAA